MLARGPDLVLWYQCVSECHEQEGHIADSAPVDSTGVDAETPPRLHNYGQGQVHRRSGLSRLESERRVIDKQVGQQRHAQLPHPREEGLALRCSRLRERHRALLLRLVDLVPLLVVVQAAFFLGAGLPFALLREGDRVGCEENSLGEQSLEGLDHGWDLQVPEESVLQDVRLHLDELVEGERTLHQLADVLDDWVLYLVVLGADEEADSRHEGADLLADHALARRKLGPQALDGVYLCPAAFGRL